PTYCGTGCQSNCTATAECGQYAAVPGTKCPLVRWNWDCSKTAPNWNLSERLLLPVRVLRYQCV
ncbi:hypothetical protein FRC06_009216, partial [Ceratobasidium sp. 370]